jgi:hypothetical protein
VASELTYIAAGLLVAGDGTFCCRALETAGCPGLRPVAFGGIAIASLVALLGMTAIIGLL